MKKETHKLAVLATIEFKMYWEASGYGYANDFYESLSGRQKEYLKRILIDINAAPDAPEPAKMPLETALEVLRDHNEWRRDSKEDEAPAPYPHSAELVGKAIDRVCELVPEYVRLAQITSDYDEIPSDKFEEKYGDITIRDIYAKAKALLSK